MAVLIAAQNKGKSNWMRMNSAFNVVSDEYGPDAQLKAGKGWRVELPMNLITKELTAKGIEHEVVSDGKVEIA